MKSKDFKISVIIPTFNCQKYICQAIDSVLKQTFKNTEIIVIDDGSTDNTKQILEPYIKERKIIYIYQENRGLSASRNVGISNASGDYLKFLDSDDYLYDRQLELQVDEMIKEGLDINITNHELLYEDGSKKTSQLVIDTAEPLIAFLKSSRAPVHAFLVKKDLIEKVNGFDESLNSLEDHDLWLRLVSLGAKVSVSSYVGCCYRIIESSMSDNENRMFDQKCAVINKLNKNLLKSERQMSLHFKKELLSFNLELIDKCFLKRKRVEVLMNDALEMTEKLILERFKSYKYLIKILGIRAILYTRLIKNFILRSSYRKKVQSHQIAWRQQ